MLPEKALKDILGDLPLVALSGPWTRAVGYHLLQGPPPDSPSGSPPQPLWPGGATQTGGRFTPKGTFGTIYLASDPVTALMEVVAIFVNPYASIGTLRTPPWAVFAVEGFVESILDLTDSAVVDRLGTSVAEVTGDWRFTQALFVKGEGPQPPTQLLGQAAYESGEILGVRYHSAKNTGSGVGLAIFADRLLSAEASFLEVHDPHRLIRQRLP